MVLYPFLNPVCDSLTSSISSAKLFNRSHGILMNTVYPYSLAMWLAYSYMGGLDHLCFCFTIPVSHSSGTTPASKIRLKKST